MAFGLRLFSLLLFVFCGHTTKAWATDWPNELLNLTGTSVILDEASIQPLLKQSTAPDLNQLLQLAHYKAWAGARLWVVQFSQHTIKPYPISSIINTQANQRGILLNNSVQANDIPLILEIIRQSPQATNHLQTLLKQQQSDALLVISPQAELIYWHIFSPEFSTAGHIPTQGSAYLPHIWAENLGLLWQWPELKTGILIRLDNIASLTQFIEAETALKTVCSSLKTLQIVGTQTNFICTGVSYPSLQTQLALIPQLTPLPFAYQQLPSQIMIGQALSQRYLHYQWQALLEIRHE